MAAGVSSGPLSQCATCARFISPFMRLGRDFGQGGPLCAAFPDGIPKRVLRNGLDHRQTIDGDHGLRWTPEDGAEFPEYAFLPEFLGRGGKP
jgi:hypothetical protein